MKNVTLEQLLEAGCHFGHQVTRQNPKARDYVFEARDNIHIIDLTKTKEELDRAAGYIHDLAAKGGTMIVIGTKRQAKPIVEESMKKLKEEGVDGVYFVTNRWIGGILTNFSEVAKNYRKLSDYEKLLTDENARQTYTKKELGLFAKEKVKLESFYGGIATMTKMPEALFIIDTHLESLAVQEARKMGVTSVGIVDTNADPEVVDYPIPANDDAVGSIQLLLDVILDAWKEGKKAGAKAAEVAKNQESGVKNQEEKKETKETTEKKTKTKKAEKVEKAPLRKSSERQAVETSKEKIKETKPTKKMVSKEKKEETALAE